MIFTALHRLLGRQPQPLTLELLDAAVAQGLPESEDLDWKRKLPDLKTIAQSDFPKDVAAMANRGGGVIVYGVEETEKRATGRCDAGQADERYERALRAAAVTAISPPVLNLGVHVLDEDPAARAVVVTIPATLEGPHLIFRNEYFGAPVRNDADTVWMKERQVEAAYRARFDERRQTTDVLDALYDEAATNWVTEDRAWVVAIAHPRTRAAAFGRPTRDESIVLLEHASRLALTYVGREVIHPFESFDRHNLRPGLRRWTAVDIVPDHAKWCAAWTSLHDHGGVSLAMAVGGRPRRDGEHPQPNRIDSVDIEAVIGDFMALLRSVSQTRLTAEFDVRIGIETRLPGPIRLETVDAHGFVFDGSTIPLNRYSPVRATVTADAPADDFQQQLYDLAQDCINQGGITFLRQIKAPPQNR